MYSIEVLMPWELVPLHAFDMGTFVQDRSLIFKREKGMGIIFWLITDLTKQANEHGLLLVPGSEEHHDR